MDTKDISTSCEEVLKIFLHSSVTEEEFMITYKQLCHEKPEESKKFYHQLLTKLEETASIGNFDSFKIMNNLIGFVTKVESKQMLKTYFADAGNPIASTNLIILSCKHKNIHILKHIFENNNKILNNLSIDIGRQTVVPEDEDETRHNAFYYAIRSGTPKLLEMLIKKWSGDYFFIHNEKLEEILSRTYEELKLKNVTLSNEIDVFVENKLIHLRSLYVIKQKKNIKGTEKDNIIERILLVLENINILKTDYSEDEEVDEKFVFIAKFITQNIHILKRQLKSTYSKLPWEEIEFCLVSFISSLMKRQEMNLFYRAVLDKNKVIMYLQNFANLLENEINIVKCINISKISNMPNIKRDEVVTNIIHSNPQFEQLYKDFQQIRDIYSLEKINYHLKLASTIDPTEREEQLVITRTLQVIGEYLKNTLESPKLSSSTSELLLLSLPKNTRKIITGLRNSLSHSYSLGKRIKIEETADINFFTNVQNDVQKICKVINDILFNAKITFIRILLTKIITSENVNEIKDICEILSCVEVELTEPTNFKMTQCERLKQLITQLKNILPEKANHDNLFKKLEKKFDFEDTLSENKIDFKLGLIMLKNFSNSCDDSVVNKRLIGEIKFRAGHTLENFTAEIKPSNLQEIAEISVQIFRNAESRMQYEEIEEMKRLIYEIFLIVQFEIENIRWIEKLQQKLNTKSSYSTVNKEQHNFPKNAYKIQLKQKLSELKNILDKHSLTSDQLPQNFSLYKENKKLQAAVEMLVLDVMTILGSKLGNDLFFLDKYTPLLMGKCLRNHLAHDNTILNILFSDPSIAVIANALLLTSKNIFEQKKRIVEESIQTVTSKLKNKYTQMLITVTNQKKMFATLKHGSLEEIKRVLRDGADINVKDINSQSILHCAAKGENLEVLKYILSENVEIDGKDNSGQNPLHVAAAFGRAHIVKFLVTKLDLCVDDVDKRGRTPLHIAATNGHKDTIECLINSNASTTIKDVGGLLPINYATENNHLDIVEMLLSKGINVDTHQVIGGFTLLHEAVEYGHPQLVNVLLNKKANVNAKTDNGWTPLHAATKYGHLEIAKILVKKGANVNAAQLNGCTPLFYAVEYGHDKIVDLLLRHRASVNVASKIDNTLIHVAAQCGFQDILKNLLKNNADANSANTKGNTPLHLAAITGKQGIVITLLKHNVNVNVKNKDYYTPLYFAAQYGHKEIVEMLIEYKADVDHKDRNKRNLLCVAVANDHKDIVNILLKNGAAVDAQDINGFTPLHLAAQVGNKDTIEILIQNCAKINFRDCKGCTPLHWAVFGGCSDTVEYFLKNKANINVKSDDGLMPLHTAIIKGHIDIVKLLVDNKAEINCKDPEGNTVLHIAVKEGVKEVVQLLIASGAIVNAYNEKKITPLLVAVKFNRKEIVQLLMSNGADVNAEGESLLSVAVASGYKEIVDILLKNCSSENISSALLHKAAFIGHVDITQMLIRKRANVNAITDEGHTPLHTAAHNGHADIVEILIANGADVNFNCIDGTPLHLAVGKCHKNIVGLLLDKGADVSIRDGENRTALEFAVAFNHFDIAKMLLQSKKTELNVKGARNFTLLHIAAQEGNLDIVKYLVHEGSDVDARNSSGARPVHIAAREGHEDIVEFFLNSGTDVNELGMDNQTILHYATIHGHVEVVKLLLARNCNVNAKDANGRSPIHIAAYRGYKKVVEVLLESGAIYNILDHFHRTPLETTRNKDVINLLTSTKQLFDAVKNNKPLDTERCIKQGAFINAKNTDNVTPLHLASWKGYRKIVNILLEYKTNSNVSGKGGATPLHYATKFAHFEIVRDLLLNGAVYNVTNDSGKTPLDFTEHPDIIQLLKLVNDSFDCVQNGNLEVIKKLNKIKEFDTVKAIMNARNEENKTLVHVAIQRNFPEVEQLKQILQGDVTTKMNQGLLLVQYGNYQEALSIFNSLLEKRIAILGPDNPGTLDIQTNIGVVLFKQGKYSEALNILKEICQKQKIMLGLHNKDTLSTRSTIALVLHNQEKNEEALKIFEEVYYKQKEILGPTHIDTLTTQLHMALALERLKKYDEALIFNREYYEEMRRTQGEYAPATISAQNNIAMVLSSKGNYDEALKMYNEVLLKKKVVLGVHHEDTIRTMHNIAVVLHHQRKYHETIKVFQEVLNLRKEVLGPNHPDTLTTELGFADVLFSQQRFIRAFKIYKKILNQIIEVFGRMHASVLHIEDMIKAINLAFTIEGKSESQVLLLFQTDVNIAANEGDIKTLELLLKDGADVNEADIEGRTPLHFAVNNGHITVTNLLLRNGSNFILTTNKGNTPLHTATVKGYKDIIEVLLRHVSHDKLRDFVNAKTLSGGNTSLHVAAKNGFLDIVKLLMKHGAIYDVKNKQGKTPLDLSPNKNVTDFLKLAAELFEYAKIGSDEITRRFKLLKHEDLTAMMGVRNVQANTLLENAINNGHNKIACHLSEIYKKYVKT